MIAGISGHATFTSGHVDLDGVVVVVYSDGVIEPRNDVDQDFGEDGLDAHLRLGGPHDRHEERTFPSRAAGRRCSPFPGVSLVMPRRPVPRAAPRRRWTSRPPARPRRIDLRAQRRRAQQELRRFRQGSGLALALATLLLVLWGDPAAEGHSASAQAAALPGDGGVLAEVSHTFGELANSAFAYAPRLVLALAVLAVAALLSRVLRAVLRRALGQWERTDAALAIGHLVVFAVAAIAAVSILAGDARAVAGSVGLLGLAASWALQAPIESFTGWLLNAFHGYYRVGDRVAVGDVFGDVYSIDVLTTTVWEAGGRNKPVAAAQATGALITFPNSEVLRSNIVNYTRDFPHVWDELAIGVTNESDLAYASRVIEDVARRVLGPQMAEAAAEYDRLLTAHDLAFGVDEVPRVYLSARDAWTDCTVRYLVPVRTRRHWSSILLLEIGAELARPEHARRVQSAYPMTEVRLTQARMVDDRAADPPRAAD